MIAVAGNLGRQLRSKCSEYTIGSVSGCQSGASLIEVLGPAQAPMKKLRGKYRYMILLKGDDLESMREIVRQGLEGIKDIERIKRKKGTKGIDPSTTRLSSSKSSLGAGDIKGVRVTVDIEPMSIV